MHTLVESRQTYQFRLETKEDATPRVVYDYPIDVRTHPDWQEFREKLAALHADHFTLVVDAGLPTELVEPVYQQVCEVGVPCLLIPLRATEKAKLMQTALDMLYQARTHGGGTHASCFIALGGGLIGNITGLAASLVVRGIQLVHLPTTLLAATDSILSCKQGVNGEPSLDLLIKNLVGTFKAPEFALVYLSFWKSLAPDEIRSGLCELIKNVLAIHPHRYEEVAALLNPQARYSLDQFAQVFTWCFEAKQAVMRQDAHEQGAALVLEAGHTVGHALEALLGMKHGLAIALGLLVEAHISHARGWLSDTEVRQHYALIGRNGVPTVLPRTLDIDALIRLISDDNKIGYLPRREGSHVMVLLRRLGQPVEERPGLPLTYVSETELRTALVTLQA
jgi:3-dehydroquinate synthase/2-deoxy-scyllo-inosose synthase